MKVEEFVDPYLGQSWGSLGARVLTSGNQVSVTLGYPAAGLQADLAVQLAAFLQVDTVDLQLNLAVKGGSGFGQVNQGRQALRADTRPWSEGHVHELYDDRQNAHGVAWSYGQRCLAADFGSNPVGRS